MQRIAVLAFSILAREYRDKQARGNVDDKTPGRRVDRKGPTTPRQFHKEAVEEDQSWWFRKYDEQTTKDKPHQHRAATHPGKPTKTEISRKQLSSQRQGER